MSIPELHISINQLLEVPIITVVGTVHQAHIPAISAMITSILKTKYSSVVLDLKYLTYSNELEKENTADMLHNLPEDLKVHLVCSESLKQSVNKTKSDHRVSLYATTDEIADMICRDWAAQQRQATPALRQI